MALNRRNSNKVEQEIAGSGQTGSTGGGSRVKTVMTTRQGATRKKAAAPKNSKSGGDYVTVTSIDRSTGKRTTHTKSLTPITESEFKNGNGKKTVKKIPSSANRANNVAPKVSAAPYRGGASAKKVPTYTGGATAKKLGGASSVKKKLY